MADEDEIDILGDFSFDNLFPKEDNRISGCYDGGVLGTQSSDQLLHDCINPAWLLEPSQSCWFSPPHDTHRISPAEVGLSTSLGSNGSLSWEDGENTWTEREKSLLERGVELFGRSWNRVAQFVGTKSPQQIKAQARLLGISGVTSVSESSEIPEEFVNDFNKTASVTNLNELIDDMAIPASMEEVIAAVTTAQPTVSSIYNNCERRRHSSISSETSKPRGKGRKNKRGRNSKKQQQIQHNDDDLNSDLDQLLENDAELIITTKEPLSVRFVSEGEELIRLQKESEQSEDSEIEIDDEPIENNNNMVQDEIISDIKQEEEQQPQEEPEPEEEELIQEEETPNLPPKKEEIEKIFNFPVPKQAITLKPESITDEEKEIHFEFFLGRSAKTPSRYLKIRNYIIDCWLQNKPKYVSKTSVRTGLRNCGDVNCIGRIHAYLEQIGAINFACEQTQYRPLVVPLTYSRHTYSNNAKIKTEIPLILRTDIRPRKKKLDFFDSDGEGGLTISHDANGAIVYSEMHREPKKERKSGHENLRLVHCCKFSENKPAPYNVVLDIGALLLMDVHAHACYSEVIGLLGGQYDQQSKVLHILRGVACKSKSTGVQCDMCPISQTEASEQIHSAGLEVVGWYHSHPTFLPNPSLQDLDTQIKVQTWFDKTEAPFLGIIVSPYFMGNKTLASNFRCLIVKEEEGERKPYQFPVLISSSQTCSDTLVHRISQVFQHLGQGTGTEIVPFYESTLIYPTTTYLEKLISSIRLHINQCQPSLSSNEAENLITGIIETCSLNTPKSDSRR